MHCGKPGLFIKFFDIKSPKAFKTLTALVKYYAAKKQKGMPCKLDMKMLAQDVASHDREREQAIVNPGYPHVCPTCMLLATIGNASRPL